MLVGLVGGTGKEGRGLAQRWATAGHRIRIGSRDAARGKAEAAVLSQAVGVPMEGGDNLWAVSGVDVAVLSVPYSAHRSTLEELKSALAGTIVLDIAVPLVPPRVHIVEIPEGKSAALEAQAILGDTATVVAALHHVGSTQLQDLTRPLEGDVLVCSDDDTARSTIMSLICELGARALDAGPLKNSVALEALTPVLIHLTKRYKSRGAGVRFTGLG